MDEATLGCARCMPHDPEAAWSARAAFDTVAELIDESHYHVMILACGSCGQCFLSVFAERVDWVDSDDPQFSTLLAITQGESEDLVRRGASVEEQTLEAIGPSRRSLRSEYPKGGPKALYWSSGLRIDAHD